MLATEKGGLPLYMQVKALFIGKISQGEWLPGSIIPSEISLSRDLGVSQGTVRKAITDLVETNVLRRKQGRGTFVSNHDSNRALFHFFHIVDDKGHKVLPDSQVLSCRSSKASRHARDKLQLDIHSPQTLSKVHRLSIPVFARKWCSRNDGFWCCSD